MEELDSKMEMMTEETAQGLIDAFEKLNKSLSETPNICARFNEVINREMARQVVDKFLGYVEKYTNATFLTRWYWKNKAIKMAQAVKDADEFISKS